MCAQPTASTVPLNRQRTRFRIRQRLLRSTLLQQCNGTLHVDPQSLNLYAYVRNNPLVRTDPDGHCPWCALAGAAIGVGAEILADKMTGKPVTVRGVIGAAVGGAIIGGSAGLATGEGIAIEAAIAGTSSVVGGIAERTIQTGSIDKATENPGEIVKDAALGAGGAIVNKGVETLVGRAAGGTVRSLETKLGRAQAPKTIAKLTRQLEKASKPVAAKQQLAGKASELVHDTAVKTHDKQIGILNDSR